VLRGLKLKYLVFQINTLLYGMDKKVPYPFNVYRVKTKDQLWKIVSYKVDKKKDKIIFVVTCPKNIKGAIECKEWIGEACDVVKIIL